MCYHVNFGSAVSEGVLINRRELQKLGSAGDPPLRVGRDRPPKPNLCYHVKFRIFCVKGCVDK